MSVARGVKIVCGFAGLLLLSSCSNENLVGPEPPAAVANLNSDLRNGIDPNLPPGGFLLAPYLPATIGQTGDNVYPAGWDRHVFKSPDNPQELPTGSSTLTHLWGDLSKPWKKPLPLIPGINNLNSIVTVTSRLTPQSNINDKDNSAVKVRVLNLVPGQKYRMFVYVGTTVHDVNVNSYSPDYAKKIRFYVTSGNNTLGQWVDLTGKEAVWVGTPIIFTAGADIATLHVESNTSPGKFSYAHIFVDKYSIKPY